MNRTLMYSPTVELLSNFPCNNYSLSRSVERSCQSKNRSVDLEFKSVQKMSERSFGQDDLSSCSLIDSKRLLYFVSVARVSSFTVAEVQLGVNQSTLTRSVQQLEADLGVALLERNGRGVSLTAFGKVFLEHAERILGDMRDAVDQLARLQRSPGGEISIAAPNMFATMYLPQVIRRMTAMHPNLRMNIMEGSTGHVHERLASGDVDVAVLVVPPRTPKIVAKKILEEPLVLIVRSDHVMANRKSVEREEIAGLELVLPVSAHGSRQRIDEYFEEIDMRLDIKINADSLAVIKALVCESDRYCTILPPRACAQEIANGQVISIPFVPSLQRSVFIARLRDQSVSPYTKTAMQEIEVAVRDGHRRKSAE